MRNMKDRCGVMVASSDGVRLWPTSLDRVLENREFSDAERNELLARAQVVGVRVVDGYSLRVKETGEEFLVSEETLGKDFWRYMDLGMAVRNKLGRNGLVIIVS